ncbi:DUF4148 domain-containing protein [Paraburkholderia denitrificans]|uniref:DUF4148 domain-containing protein n=1 Tax=Paraburkholderia denitrificans TaxID=694025 RepID=A0ABW0JE37_9BURK
MNTIIKTLALALAIAAPAVSFAQSTNGPLTRAQVEQQLIQMKDAGYKSSKNQYPADIQAAESRMAAQQATASNPGATSYGGAAIGTSQTGDRVSRRAWNEEYRHR